MPPLISAVVTTIDRLLRNIVTAAMDLTGSGAPLDNPLAWTILAWTRRTFFNQAPTTNPQQLTENSAGVITGTLGALDADGDPLTYTITQQPTHGLRQSPPAHRAGRRPPAGPPTPPCER